MAFKFAFLALMTTALIATCRAGVIGAVTYTNAPVVAKVANPAVDAVASTHQNVVRSFDGTVSQYSKVIDTPYSSVRKEDTRISNNVYTPAIAKTVAYAAPAKTVAYASVPAQAATAVYTHSAPVASKPLYAAPSAAVYTEHHEPTAVYHHEPIAAHAPAAVYTHAEPIATKTVSYAAPVVNSAPVVHAEPAHVYHNYHHAPAVATATTTYNHGPDASTYSHNAPGIAAYGTSQTVRYSPAEMVSHMSFDGFGTHWGF